MDDKKISVTALAQNVEITFNMHKDELETLKGVLTLAEQKLKDWHGIDGLPESTTRQLRKADNLIAMIRGAILRY